MHARRRANALPKHTQFVPVPVTLLSVTTMSTDNRAATPSASNFTSIFYTALDEYKRLTGQNLHTHPFATAFDGRNSPDTVLDVFLKQAQLFDNFHKRDNKVMKWLTPIVHVLLTLSGTLGEGVGLVRPSLDLYSNSYTCFSAILTRKVNLHGRQRSPCGAPLPSALHSHL